MINIVREIGIAYWSSSLQSVRLGNTEAFQDFIESFISTCVFKEGNFIKEGYEWEITNTNYITYFIRPKKYYNKLI